MLRLKATIIAVLAALTSLSAQVVTITNTTAGGLKDKISADSKKTLTSIKITGPLNAEDINVLRAMATPDSGKLADIDLSATQLLAIGDEAFTGCKNLTKITLPSSVGQIGRSAFGGCKNLTSISLPEKVATIGNYAFAECEKLKTFSFPKSVTAIPNGCFADCSSLETITLPSTMTSIGKEAFARCVALKTIDIPASITSIGGAAFAGCQNLSFIKVDVNNKHYCSTAGGVLYSKDGKYILQYPAGKKGDVYTIPPGVIRVGTYSFSGCKNIKKVTIPSTCTSLGYGVFNDCSNLQDVELSAGLTKIPEDLFFGCSSLTAIKLPSAINKIDKNAFYGCSKLKEITLPKIVTSIGRQAFYGCSSLEKIELPENITEVPQGCFTLCSRLKEVKLPNSITSIGDMAFGGDSALTSLQLPSSLTTIGGGAFAGCSKLQAIKLPSTIKTVGYASFVNCSSLKTLTVPAAVDSFGISSLSGCDGLTELVVEGSKPPRSNILAGYAISDTVQLTVPSGTEEAYHSALGWKEFKHINRKVYEIVHEETEDEINEKMSLANEGSNMEEFFLVYSSIASETATTVTLPEDNNIYEKNEVDAAAHFVNGTPALDAYLKDSYTYPTHANGKQGNVKISFVVEKDGSLTHLKVLQSQGNDLDAEAVATVFSMPKWIPAQKEGKDVRSNNEITISIHK